MAVCILLMILTSLCIKYMISFNMVCPNSWNVYRFILTFMQIHGTLYLYAANVERLACRAVSKIFKGVV